jgi:signal transduction histidine kinase
MQQQDLTNVKNNINGLREHLRSAADDGELEQFLQIIHRPGFTTVAEAALINGVVNSMLEHAKVLAGLKQVLMSGASKVELNPQPLPPGAQSSKTAR